MTHTDNNHRSGQKVHQVRFCRGGLKEEMELKPGFGNKVGKRQWEKKGKAFQFGAKEK